jgi:hypothetical protein
MITMKGFAGRVSRMGKKKKGVPRGNRLPDQPTVRLDPVMFENLWWYCHVTEKVPGDVLLELAGHLVEGRARSEEVKISRLKQWAKGADEIRAGTESQPGAGPG